jgi:hypothetical protein
MIKNYREYVDINSYYRPYIEIGHVIPRQLVSNIFKKIGGAKYLFDIHVFLHHGHKRGLKS